MRDRFHPQLLPHQDRSRVRFHVRGNAVQGNSVRDLSPRQQTVTNNAVTIGQTAGYSGDYLSFNGSSSYLSVALPADDRLGSDDFCMRVVFRTSSSAVQILMGTGGGGANNPINNQVLIYLNAGSLDMAAYNGAGSAAFVMTGGGSLADGRWHVAECWRTGTAWSLARDGVVVDTETLGGNLNSHSTMFVGSRSTGTDAFFFSGGIHEAVMTKFQSVRAPYQRGQLDWPAR
jgi:hypothetical protein